MKKKIFVWPFESPSTGQLEHKVLLLDTPDTVKVNLDMIMVIMIILMMTVVMIMRRMDDNDDGGDDDDGDDDDDDDDDVDDDNDDDDAGNHSNHNERLGYHCYCSMKKIVTHVHV